jgi:hypothetical protein
MEKSLFASLVAEPTLACCLLFGVLLAAIYAGRLVGLKRAAHAEDSPGTGAINGAVFALLGLILAFSFSGAAGRFEHRRDLIVAETNAVGTAYLRIDLLPADAQHALREAFKRYVDSRVSVYDRIGNPDALRVELRKSAAIQAEIWALAVAAGKRPEAAPGSNQLLLPALNEMIDLTATRAFATMMHPPEVIHIMLIGLAAISGFLAGLGLAGNRRRPFVHPVSFALIMTGAIYVTIDLEYPRAGFIRVDGFEDAVIAFSRGQ